MAKSVPLAPTDKVLNSFAVAPEFAPNSWLAVPVASFVTSMAAPAETSELVIADADTVPRADAFITPGPTGTVIVPVNVGLAVGAFVLICV